MTGIIVGLLIMLADAFVLWCCCRIAGMADQAEEETLDSGKEDKERE